jgi:LacI family transcriptional regulator
MPSSPITMQQIADRAGVSAQTVANVLQGRTRGTWASTAKRSEKIRRIASDLGYRPNAAARATASGRFNAACLVSSTQGHRSTMFHGLVRGAHDELAQRQMHLTVAIVDDEKLTDERFVPKALKEWTADGLLLNYTHDIPGALTDLIDRYRIPSVWINSQQPADCVYFDDHAAGRQLTEYLLGLGHRRIAFVSYGQKPHYSTTARRGGYDAAMTDAGLTPRFIHRRFVKPTGHDPGEDTVALSAGWLAEPDRPTAVLAYSQIEAVPTLVAAAQMGLKLPDDLSITTFGDSVNEPMGMRLTRMWTSHGDLARVAVPMLMDKIDAPARPLEPRVVPLQFWKGRSCAPARV